MQVEVERVVYDGEGLKLRVFLGALDGGVVIDRRLIENVHVIADAVRDCATGKEVGFWFIDHFPSPPRGDDLLLLEPGYWFGADLKYPLFMNESGDGGGPPCIEVELTVQPEPWEHESWRLPLAVRAERATVDAGGGGGESPDAGFDPSDAGL